MSDTNGATTTEAAAREGKARIEYDLAAKTLTILQPKNKGGATIATYDWGGYPANILEEAVPKGLMEKFRDSYSAKGSDVRACSDDIHAQLSAGTWNVAGDREVTTVFHRAWFNITAKARAAANQPAVAFEDFVARVREMDAAGAPVVAQMRASAGIKLEMENVRVAMAREKIAALKEAAKTDGGGAIADPFAA